MTAQIYIYGVIGTETSLMDVIRQFKSFKKVTDVEVVIQSSGGSVAEGKAIFNYLKSLNLPVTTIAQRAYSIAAHIFMAGSTRIVEEGEGRILLHLPWASVDGRADRLEQVAKQLSDLENEFVDFYSGYTDIDKDSVLTLLTNETFLSSDEALSLGLATEIQIATKAVALINNDLTLKNEVEMTKAEKFYSAVKDLFTVSTEIKALVLQDANGVEINFPEVEVGQEVAVGDVAEVDNSPAEGEYVSPEGSVWVFEAGVLIEIRTEVVEEEEQQEEEEELPQEESPEAKAEREIEEFFKKLLDLEEGMAKLQTENEAHKVKIQAMEEANEKLVHQDELVALKKLIGSEEIIVAQDEQKQNITKSGGLMNSIRG